MDADVMASSPARAFCITGQGKTIYAQIFTGQGKTMYAQGRCIRACATHSCADHNATHSCTGWGKQRPQTRDTTARWTPLSDGTYVPTRQTLSQCLVSLR